MSDDYRYLGFQFWSVIESVWQHLFTSAFTIWEPQSPDPNREPPFVQVIIIIHHLPSHPPTPSIQACPHQSIRHLMFIPPLLNVYSTHHNSPGRPQSNRPVSHDSVRKISSCPPPHAFHHHELVRSE